MMSNLRNSKYLLSLNSTSLSFADLSRCEWEKNVSANFKLENEFRRL